MSKLIEHDWDDDAVDWSEDDLQIAVAQWLKRQGYTFAADQNAGKRSKRDGGKRKLAGMAAGEPDIRVYLPGPHLVLVEMKRFDGSVSAAQASRHIKLVSLGYEVRVLFARTPASAVLQIADIMDGRLAA